MPEFPGFTPPAENWLERSTWRYSYLYGVRHQHACVSMCSPAAESVWSRTQLRPNSYLPSGPRPPFCHIFSSMKWKEYLMHSVYVYTYVCTCTRMYCARIYTHTIYTAHKCTAVCSNNGYFTAIKKELLLNTTNKMSKTLCCKKGIHCII